MRYSYSQHKLVYKEAVGKGTRRGGLSLYNRKLLLRTRGMVVSKSSPIQSVPCIASKNSKRCGGYSIRNSMGDGQSYEYKIQRETCMVLIEIFRDSGSGRQLDLPFIRRYFLQPRML